MNYEVVVIYNTSAEDLWVLTGIFQKHKKLQEQQ